MAEEKPDWAARISSWRSSGKSGRVWCNDNSISYPQFKYWRHKFRKAEQLVTPGQFVPLKVSSSTPLCIECNGTFLHVSSGFDASLLRQVVAVLKES